MLQWNSGVSHWVANSKSLPPPHPPRYRRLVIVHGISLAQSWSSLSSAWRSVWPGAVWAPIQISAPSRTPRWLSLVPLPCVAPHYCRSGCSPRTVHRLFFCCRVVLNYLIREISWGLSRVTYLSWWAALCIRGSPESKGIASFVEGRSCIGWKNNSRGAMIIQRWSSAHHSWRASLAEFGLTMNSIDYSHLISLKCWSWDSWPKYFLQVVLERNQKV